MTAADRIPSAGEGGVEDAARAGDGAPGAEPGISDLELHEFFEAVFQRHGFDFRHYAPGYLRRRVRNAMEEQKSGTVARLRERVLEDGDGAALAGLLRSLTICTTAMFRDPDFHLLLRTRVVPMLRTYPFLRVWVAGCSTGEEAYSLAILFHEEGLYPRCRIYATDASEMALARARARILPLAAMREYGENYRQAGGRGEFADYYTRDGRSAMVRSFLQEQIVFSQHNLVTDGSFNEFHLILCRNVLIYFDHELQLRVHELMRKSLVRFGFLGLGKGENLGFCERREHYEEIAPRGRLYRRIN